MVTDLFGNDTPAVNPRAFEHVHVTLVDVPRYYPRSHYLPDARQSYLLAEGVRPTFGPCPSCVRPEALFCERTCDLTDPYDHALVLRRLARCKVCARRLDPGTHTRPVPVRVVPSRGVLHLVAGCRLRASVVHTYADRW